MILVQVNLGVLQALDGIALRPRALLLDAKATHPSPFLLLGLLDIVAEVIDPLTHLAVSLGKGPAFISRKSRCSSSSVRSGIAVADFC